MGVTVDVSGSIVNDTASLNVNGSLVKIGDGVVKFSGANTYKGTTTVTAGTLLLNGSHTGGGDYTVSAGAVLGGSGSTQSNVNVYGTLSPGSSIESLGVGSIAFNNGSTFAYELNTSMLNADLLYGGDGSTLTIGGTVTLSLSDLGSNALVLPGTKFTLISYDGAWNGGTFDGYADDSQFVLGSNTWLLNYNDLLPGVNFPLDALANGTSFVTITAVPEPTSMGLLAAAGALLMARRRRRA